MKEKTKNHIHEEMRSEQQSTDRWDTWKIQAENEKDAWRPGN